ncbi:MAG: S-methyl-5'-thioinosine phosphorylase [Syntrophomonadaceae bacterium]|nr:S-methyl-5'-thioinosine phosphorylase [Bacillota bacterium]
MNGPDMPSADIAFIGGSGTFSINFPEDLSLKGIEIIEKDLVLETPYGRSPKLKYFRIPAEEGDSRTVITCKMHGWRSEIPRAQASLQLFWTLHQAGVKKVISEGGVGSLNLLLDLRDIVIPTDFIDHSTRKDLKVVGDNLLIMRQPICPQIHQALLSSALSRPLNRIFARGVYVVTEGYRFESPAEVSVLRSWGGDIVGQSLSPEVYLSRDIGACFGGLYTVVNYAEGVVREWRHEDLKDIFYQDAPQVGEIILDALQKISLTQECGCMQFRKPTLLEEE